MRGFGLTPWRARRGELADQPELPFQDLQHHMNRLFEDFFRGFGGADAALLDATAPRVDVTETDTALRVSAELPGVSRDQVELTLDDGVLTIRGEKKHEYDHEKEGVHRSERSFGSFLRRVALPVPVDEEGIEATFQDGVLSIELPKQDPEVGRPRRIEVRAR